MSRTNANLLLLLAGAVWGMGFVAQRTAMDDIGPLFFTGLRFLLAGLVVVPFAIAELRRKGLPVSKSEKVRAIRLFLTVGTLFFLGMIFQQYAIIGTSITNTGFLTALYAVMVPVLMVVVLRRRQPWIVWPAALLAVTGIYFLSGGNLTTLNKSDMLVIICALFWAIHLIMTAHTGIATGLPVAMACCQFFVTGIFGIAGYFLVIVMDVPEQLPTLAAISAALPEIFYAGAISAGLGFTLQAIAQRHTSESAAAVLISTESLFAALFGALFLSERLPLSGYLGCAMIFVAILIVQLIPQRNPASA